eukprot:403344252
MDKRQKKQQQKEQKKQSKNNSTSNTEIQNQSQDQEEEVKVPLTIPEQAKTQQTHLKRTFLDMSKHQHTPPQSLNIQQIGIVTNCNGKEQMMSKIIYNRFRVIRRLGPAEGPQKQVYLVMDIKFQNRLLVIKLYIHNEKSLFDHEYENNVEIYGSGALHQVATIVHVNYHEDMPHLYLNRYLFKKYALLIFEYHPHETVLDLLLKCKKHKRTMSNDLKLYLQYKVVCATYELHTLSRKAHMDLKSDNFVIAQDQDVLLIDFGSALKLDGSQNKGATFGTEQYNAPEFHTARESIDNDRFDVFSLGVVLFNIEYVKAPFQEATQSDENYRLIAQGDFQRFFTQFSESNSIRDELFQRFIKLCLSQQQTRQELQRLISNEYFSQIRSQEHPLTASVSRELTELLSLDK